MRLHYSTLIVGLTLVVSTLPAQNWVAQSSGTTASLRGISAVNAQVVWASGSGGTYLRTLDGGASWQAAVVPGAADLDFRAVHARDAQTAWLMSAGPGAKSRIYKSADGGAHWSLLYTNPDAAGFFDALQFWDRRRGVVLGDPVDGQFVVLTTEDGGATWLRHKLPPALPNEGAFAASNACLTLCGRREIWFGTGGPSGARVFHSPDGGEHWQVTATPLRHDSAGAGIFSLGFSDARNGIAVGGDYEKPKDTRGNVATTADAGQTWREPGAARPNGYRSAVAYVRARKVWIAVGTSGSDVSRNGGRAWKTFDGSPYNAIGVAGDAVWAVGPAGRVAKLR